MLSVRIAQGSNQVNGVFKCSPVGKQLLNKLIPRFCTDDRLEHLSECRRHFGEDIVDHGSQSRHHAGHSFPSVVQVANI